MKKQQSQNWDKYNSNPEYHKPENFPYKEGFPKFYSGKEYNIIILNGGRPIAEVDASREFMSEGLEWKILSSDKGEKGNINSFLVKAWKEI